MRRSISLRISKPLDAATSARTRGPHPNTTSSIADPVSRKRVDGVSLFLRVLSSSALAYAIASCCDLAVASTLGTGALLLGGTVPGGLALGYLQWLGMRERVHDRKRWLVFSVVAWTLGNPLLLSIVTPGRMLAFTTHALLVSFLRPPDLGGRRTVGLTSWIGASVFGAVVNGYVIEVSRQGVDHGLRALLVLALGSGVLIAAMQAMVFAAIHGDFAVAAERLAAALGGVGRRAGAPLQSEARLRWVYATARVT